MRRRTTTSPGDSKNDRGSTTSSLPAAGWASVAVVPLYSDPANSLPLVPSLAPSHSTHPGTKHPTFFPASPPLDLSTKEASAKQPNPPGNISTPARLRHLSRKAERAAANEAAAIPLPVFTIHREEWLTGIAATLCHLRWHAANVVVGVSNGEDAAAVEAIMLAAPHAPGKVEVLRMNTVKVDSLTPDAPEKDESGVPKRGMTTTTSSPEVRTGSRAPDEPRSRAADDASLALDLMQHLKSGLQQQQHANSPASRGSGGYAELSSDIGSISCMEALSWSSAELVYFTLPTRLPIFNRGAFVDASALVAPFAYVSPQPLVLEESRGNQDKSTESGDDEGGADSKAVDIRRQMVFNTVGAWRLPDAAVDVSNNGDRSEGNFQADRSSIGSNFGSSSSGGDMHKSTRKDPTVEESICAAEARELVSWAGGGEQPNSRGGSQGAEGQRWQLAFLSPVCVAGDETIGATMRERHAGGGAGHKR